MCDYILFFELRNLFLQDFEKFLVNKQLANRILPELFCFSQFVA